MSELQAPGFRESLDDLIKGNLAAYEESVDQIVGLIDGAFQVEQILAPAFDLYSRIVAEPHEGAVTFQTLRHRVRNLRIAALETLDTSEGGPPTWSWIQSLGPSKQASIITSWGTEPVPSAPAPPSGRMKEIYDVIEAAGKPLRAAEIAAQLAEDGLLTEVENPEQAVSANLSRGIEKGYFWRPRRGVYSIIETSKEDL